MERKILFLFLFEGAMNAVSGQTPVLQIFQPATEVGSSFTLQCTVTINKAIEFQLNNTGQGSCSAPFLSMLGTCTPSDITQNLTTSVTSWTISPAQPEHDGTWVCVLGSTDSNEADLQIYQLPGSIITQNGISSDVIVNDTSSYPIVVEVDCLFSGNGPIVELQFAATVNASVAMTCTTLSTVCSACTGCSAYNCSIILNQALISGQISVNTAYTLYIKVGVTGTTEKFTKPVSSPHTVTFEIKSKVSNEVRKLSVTEVGKKGIPYIAGGGTGAGSGSGAVHRYYKVTITITIAEVLLFKNQHDFHGSVVYGIQIVIVSAVCNILTILTAGGVLWWYHGQYTDMACLFLLLLAALFSIVGVGIFIFIVFVFGKKEKIHIKLKEKEDGKKISAHGIKLTNHHTALINFKVKSSKDAHITLHGITRSSQCQDEEDIEIEIVLGCGCPPLFDAQDHILDESNGALLRNVLRQNEYCSFHLACENNSIKVMDGKKKVILQWTVSADIFEIRDIKISHMKRDDRGKGNGTEKEDGDDSSKDGSTKKEKGEIPETSAEWIFLFRKGDSLCEIEEHEREKKEDLPFIQTVMLIIVMILPIAWFVMFFLIVRYCLKSKGKNTDNTDSEMGVKLNQNEKESSEQQIKNQNDTKGKWFDFIWFSCFHNSVKPNSTTDDNKPKSIMPGSYLANLPKGRKLPQLGEIVTQGNEPRKSKKKGKKKKKIKNQDSSMNAKQQSHSDKQNITFQPEIAVAADKLEAE